MFLIIPAIPIRHGHCGAEITPLHEVNGHPVYSPNPADRARLLRKENAKAVHLEFLDCEPWEAESLAIIRSVREVVDIPIEIAVFTIPTQTGLLSEVFTAGANRLFLPSGTSEDAISALCSEFGRKLIRTFTLDAITPETMDMLKSLRVDRIAVELSHQKDSEQQNELLQVDWQQLEHAALGAKERGIHITAMHGVAGYPDLHRIQSLAPAIDSLVLCRALNENRFPCQFIWRELEEEFAVKTGQYANLWTNPLEGKPHV